jgi:hypothetical protein
MCVKRTTFTKVCFNQALGYPLILTVPAAPLAFSRRVGMEACYAVSAVEADRKAHIPIKWKLLALFREGWRRRVAGVFHKGPAITRASGSSGGKSGVAIYL